MRCIIPLLLVVAALTGCQVGPPAIVTGQAKLAADDSAAYLDRLSSQPTVTEVDAFKGILMVMGESKDMTFSQAVKLLTERKVVDGSWDFQAVRPITRGKVAYMVYQACHMRGGLTLTLAGPSQRYCLKELQNEGMMAAGFPYNLVSGMEYVAILSRADELVHTGKVSPVMTKEAIGPW